MLKGIYTRNNALIKKWQKELNEALLTSLQDLFTVHLRISIIFAYTLQKKTCNK